MPRGFSGVIDRPCIRVFKRLETDDEFRKRLPGNHCRSTVTGTALDEYAWDYCKMQRRIIEDES